MPLISVVMGVHDEKEEHLNCAINSILNQTYREFEFIIIDDCSDEKCASFLRKVALTDSRIKLYRNERNLGLTESLNIGLALASGEFIARMDADDYSTHDRFEKQVRYMDTHPETDILGGGVVSFGDYCMYLSPACGYSNAKAQCELFFQSTLCHPSVMIRKTFLDEHGLQYDETVKTGQDYDMWERCSIYGHISVMEDVVLYYRTHSKQITSTNRSEQYSTAREVQIRRVGRIGLTPTEEEYKCHLMLAGYRDKTIKSKDVKKWAKKLVAANNITSIADKTVFEKAVSERYKMFRLRNGHIYISDMFYLTSLYASRRDYKKKLNDISNTIMKLGI